MQRSTLEHREGTYTIHSTVPTGYTSPHATAIARGALGASSGRAALGRAWLRIRAGRLARPGRAWVGGRKQSDPFVCFACGWCCLGGAHHRRLWTPPALVSSQVSTLPPVVGQRQPGWAFCRLDCNPKTTHTHVLLTASARSVSMIPCTVQYNTGSVRQTDGRYWFLQVGRCGPRFGWLGSGQWHPRPDLYCFCETCEKREKWCEKESRGVDGEENEIERWRAPHINLPTHDGRREGRPKAPRAREVPPSAWGQLPRSRNGRFIIRLTRNQSATRLSRFAGGEAHGEATAQREGEGANGPPTVSNLAGLDSELLAQPMPPCQPTIWGSRLQLSFASSSLSLALASRPARQALPSGRVG